VAIAGERTATRAEEEKESGRLEAFSDGVFAIAVTLLVLMIDVPTLSGPPTPQGLAAALATNWPSYVAFCISFTTVLIMWVHHHAIFKLVQRVDATLLFANGILLLFVTAVPFPTAIVAQYFATPAARVACAVYAGQFILIGIGFNLLWWSATYRRRLVRHDVSPALLTSVTRSAMVGPLCYAGAALLALWSAYASLAACFVLMLFWAASAYERPTQRHAA
jgi:uncharacterized membrane protein